MLLSLKEICSPENGLVGPPSWDANDPVICSACTLRGRDYRCAGQPRREQPASLGAADVLSGFGASRRLDWRCAGQPRRERPTFLRAANALSGPGASRRDGRRRSGAINDLGLSQEQQARATSRRPRTDAYRERASARDGGTRQDEITTSAVRSRSVCARRASAEASR